ncbi:hypothetical protein Salat_2461200 [Sesamum alatum]|uniref:Uncharacterized protein n=1 Tax=Sesamum alatum TaxID=300844 RepID=A0AAE2CBT4_9LAMI|nr:hypothetical protein Salat_2461200 [Sesamum alatum]
MAKNATTPTCNINFCYCRDRPIDPADAAVKPQRTTTCAAAPKKFDAVAARLLNGVTAAFFASLERCSCINIATKDDVEDGGSLPLIRGGALLPAADVRFTGNRTAEEESHLVEDNKEVIHVKSTRQSK